jgi:hypothetical protein
MDIGLGDLFVCIKYRGAQLTLVAPPRQAGPHHQLTLRLALCFHT